MGINYIMSNFVYVCERHHKQLFQNHFMGWGAAWLKGLPGMCVGSNPSISKPGVMPASTGRLRQEDQKFCVIPDHILSLKSGWTT